MAARALAVVSLVLAACSGVGKDPGGSVNVAGSAGAQAASGSGAASGAGSGAGGGSGNGAGSGASGGSAASGSGAGEPGAEAGAGPDAAAGAPSGGDSQARAREFAPDVLPPPPADVSNQYADDPKASALGEQLFLETRFAGALLDLDADGGPDSLGLRGETGKVSCAGCHEPENGFLDTRSAFKQISLGTGWTHRRTPTLLDVGQAKIVMWGGRHSTLYAQVFGPLENPVEMNSSRLFVAQQIAALYEDEYEEVFGAGALAPLADEERFPPLTPETTGCRLTRTMDHPRALPPDPLYECRGIPGDGADYDGMAAADQDLVTRIVVNAGKAIAAYERTLRCGAGRFDDWAHGDSAALTAAEQRGFALFIGKGKCATCHSGPYFSDQAFHALGLSEAPTRAGILNGDDRGALADLQAAKDDPLGITGPYSDGDDGRLPEVLDPSLEGAFRTPTLRCVGSRPSFLHSGLLRTLEEVVAFHDRGGDPPGSYQGESELEPLGLTATEQTELVAFLQSLDGTER